MGRLEREDWREYIELERDKGETGEKKMNWKDIKENTGEKKLNWKDMKEKIE